MRRVPDAYEIADILVVDDTPENLQLLSEMLKSWGYKARPVTSGALALQAARSKRPNLILLDIHMPEMDGYQLCGHLKEDATLKEIPVLFISALNETADKVKAFECGGADYIAKPFQADEIHARIKAHLELQQQKRRLRRLSHHIVQLQEAERGRIALELHDHITQPLCGILVCNQLLANKLSAHDEPARHDAFKLCELIGHTVDEAERISRDLRPSVLDQLGLVAVMQDTCKEFTERTGVPLNLACVQLAARLPADIELSLYRILQESLRNVEKHARACHVTVSLTESVNIVQLTIHDDGIGFDPDHRPAGLTGKSDMGLLSMRERATYMGGDLKVKSAPSGGTEIVICIPLPLLFQGN